MADLADLDEPTGPATPADPGDGGPHGPSHPHGSFRASLMYLLLGDVAAVLGLLGVVERGLSGGLLLAGAVAMPVLAVALVRPHLARLGWSWLARSWRHAIGSMAAAGVGTLVLALALGLGRAGDDAGQLLAAQDLGPVDELVVVPPSVSFADAADVVARTVAVPEVRRLIDADPLPIRRTSAVVSPDGRVPLTIQLIELDPVRAARFGNDEAATGLTPNPLAAGHALATSDVADAIGLQAGAVLPAPLRLTIDGIVARRGLTGLSTPAGDRVPNLVVGPGTIDQLVAAGWSAPVQSALAISNLGSPLDGVVYSPRVAAALRASLAQADQAQGDVLFAPEPPDRGLDRVLVETVKDTMRRDGHLRRAVTSRPLGLVSVLGATLAGALVMAAAAGLAMRRRRDLAVMRTAGFSRWSAISVVGVGVWAALLLPMGAGALIGARMATALSGGGSRRIGTVVTGVSAVRLSAAAAFPWGLSAVLLALATATVAWTLTRAPIASALAGARRDGAAAGRWTTVVPLAAVGAALLAWGIGRHGDVPITAGAALLLGALAAWTGLPVLLALLLPLGLVLGGRVGSLWTSTGAGASLSLICAAAGATVALRTVLAFVGPSGAGSRWNRLLRATRPSVGSMRSVILTGSALVVAASGVAGSMVAAGADVPGPRTAPILVRSLAEPAVQPADVASTPGVAVAVGLSLTEIDVAVAGGAGPFAPGSLAAGTGSLSTGRPPALAGDGSWDRLLDEPNKVAVSPDLLVTTAASADPVDPATLVGQDLYLRDRATSRTITVTVEALLAEPNPLASVWGSDQAALALTGSELRSSVVAVTPAAGMPEAQLVGALRRAIGDRPADVMTRTELADAHWPLSTHVVDVTRRIAGWAWLLSALALAALAVRNVLDRRHELAGGRGAGASAATLGRLAELDGVIPVIAGTAAGGVLGLLHAVRMAGASATTLRLALPATGVLLAPVLGSVFALLAGAAVGRLAARRRPVAHAA